MGIYNRQKAVNYAKEWAFSRNPRFYDFSNLGGDCANFISQCLYAGGCPMNYAGDRGWYYSSLNNRSPSWSGTEPLYLFLTRNSKTRGPVAAVVSPEEMQEGDIIQLSFDGNVFSHNLLVVGFGADTFYVASHTNDVFGRALNTYTYAKARCLHVLGYFN